MLADLREARLIEVQLFLLADLLQATHKLIIARLREIEHKRSLPQFTQPLAKHIIADENHGSANMHTTLAALRCFLASLFFSAFVPLVIFVVVVIVFALRFLRSSVNQFLLLLCLRFLIHAACMLHWIRLHPLENEI